MFTDEDSDGGTGALGGREAYFYHTNPRGDVYAISAGEDCTIGADTYSKGDIVERYEYSLYGDHRVTDADYEASDVGNPLMWGGGWKDNETCFMYMRHRYYVNGQVSTSP